MKFSLKIVLVRPRNPVNIGAAARAMANFGFDNLAVVDPYAPVWRETRVAPGAEAIVQKARAFPSLAEAVADCHLVLGATCGKNRAPDRETVLSPDIGQFLKNRSRQSALKIAAVFGPEKTGLSNAHLSLCRALLTVPAATRAPSMNLAQAVAVCCYEFSKLSGKGRAAPEKTAPPTAGEIEIAAAELSALLQKAGLGCAIPRELRLSEIRNILLKLPLCRRELFYIKKIAAAISRKIS